VTPPRDTLRERLEDLLAERATVGIHDETADLEIEALLRKIPDLDPVTFELAAAAADLAMIGEIHEPMPATVRANVERLFTDAIRNGADPRPSQATTPTSAAQAQPASDNSLRLAGTQQTAAFGRDGTTTTKQKRTGMSPAFGWLVAAAAFVLAAIGWLRATNTTIPQDTSPIAADPASLLQRVAAAPDRSQWDWNPWQAKPEGGRSIGEQNDVAGDVAWSTSLQTGVMRFVGLPPNDPSRFQYQLWIIDPEQQHPIDGGVFDIPTVGEYLVTIDPKIRVSSVAAFAVTLEKPGGVVVSDQDIRVVIAAPPSPPAPTSDQGQASPEPSAAG